MTLKNLRSLALAVAFAFVSVSIPAMADDFTIADDSSTGTYKKMLGEIIGVCSNENLNIVEAQGIHGGAPGNLDALVNNKAQAAFMHSDVFFANSQADPSYNRFQALLALYPEPIHVLALKQSKTKKTGLANIASGPQEINSLADARGFVIGAAGGGVFTARILQSQGEGGFNVTAFDNGADVIAALDRGDIAVAVFVGAAPLPNISVLNKAAYKLVPIGDTIANKVKGVYRPASINYNGLTNGPVATLAPMATLMTRKYSTETKLGSQRAFRECFNKKLDELKDNGAPNWQSVEANDHGVLPWYEIPAINNEPPVTVPKRK